MMGSKAGRVALFGVPHQQQQWSYQIDGASYSVMQNARHWQPLLRWHRELVARKWTLLERRADGCRRWSHRPLMYEDSHRFLGHRVGASTNSKKLILL